jgi:hypothetical protein
MGNQVDEYVTRSKLFNKPIGQVFFNYAKQVDYCRNKIFGVSRHTKSKYSCALEEPVRALVPEEGGAE